MRLTTITIAIAILLFVSAYAADTKIKSSVKVLTENGYYDATFYYFYNGTSASKYHYLKLEYTTPTSMSEIINYGSGIRYKLCGSTCEAGYYTTVAPSFFKKGSDTDTKIIEDGCTKYTRTGDGVKEIWYNGNTLCKATFSDGKVIKFEGSVSSSFNVNTVFSTSGYSCPAPVCKRVMDLIFVLDTSASISTSDWKKVVDF